MPPILEPEMPLVSVIIPTYNRPAYLQQAIASVLRQTYQEFEIIVADDCSPENPKNIVESFQNSRIHFRRNDSNLGVALSATHAIAQAKGVYVATLNDDDIWKEDFLEKLVPILDANPNLSLVFCNHYLMDEHGIVDQAATDAYEKNWKRDQLKEGVYQPFYRLALVDQSVCSFGLFRKDAISWEELPNSGVLWDYYINYLACRNGLGAYFYPERLAFYRIHSESETTLSGNRNAQAKIRKGKAAIFCYSRFIQDDNLKEFQPHFKQRLAEANATLGIGLLRTNQVREARQYLRSALFYQRLNLRAFVAFIFSLMPQFLMQPLVQVSQPRLISRS